MSTAQIATIVRSPARPPAAGMRLDALGATGMRRLATLLLSYVLLVCAVCTLSPFAFAWPNEVRVDVSLVPRDVLLNILLLFPAGFLYHMSLPRDAARASVGPLVFGLFVSSLFELAQLTLSDRFASPFDIAFNTLGCWAGGQAYRRACPWLSARLSGQLLLRMPLSNLFYLLTLQAWVAALGVDRDPVRLWSMLPLCACGAVVAAALYTHRLRPRAVLSPGRVAALVAAWTGLCGVPCAPALGGQVLLLALSAALITRALVWFGVPRTGGRRFEGPTLRWLAPLFVCYLAGLVWRPWLVVFEAGGPALAFAWQPGLFDERFTRASALSVAEAMVAFTVIGYAVAQALGRGRRGGRFALATAFLLGLLLCGALEAVRGLHPVLSARASSPPLAALFGAWGAAIYRSQLHVIRGLLGNAPERPRTLSDPCGPV